MTNLAEKPSQHDPVVTMKMRIANRTRAIIEAEYALNDFVQIPIIARRVRDVLKNDVDFMSRFDEMLYIVAYQIASDVIGQSRHVVRQNDTAVPRSIHSPRGVLIERALPARRQIKKSGFQTWMEHVKDRHVRLWDMSKADLRTAAAERNGRGTKEIRMAEFLLALEAKLTEGQVVKDVFTDQDLDILYQRYVRGEDGRV